MKRRRKYRLPQPDRQTGPGSPPESIELEPRSGRPPAPAVTPLPGCPAPEIIELQPRGPKPDPNRQLIPSREEIEKLPRWAQVAFAARCARRVLPLYSYFCPEALREHILAVNRAVELAEQCAELGQGNQDTRKAFTDVDAAYKSFADATAAVVAKDAVDAATFAASGAAAELSDATRTGALGAFYLLVRVATLGTARIVTAPACDLDRLTRLAKEQNWTDDTPVPPEVFGPMWDRDPPPWWRDDVLEGLAPDA